MPTPLSRRKLLQLSGPALAAALAGCSLTDEQETDTPPATTTEIQSETPPTTTRYWTPTTERCQSGPLEPTVSDGEATIFHQRSETETALFDQSATIFNETYGLSVTPTMIPTTGFWSILQTRIPKPDGPELFQWPHDLLGRYLENNLVVDQSRELRVDPCQYTDAAWEAAQYEGQTAGLPVSAETVALYYDDNIVDEPPETLAEMQTVMAEFHDPANDRYGLEMSLTPYHVSGFAQAYGGEIYDGEADELGLQSDALAQGLRLFFDKVAPYLYDMNEPFEETTKFGSGKAPFAIDGHWLLPWLEDSDVSYGLTTLPALSDGGDLRPYIGVELLYFSTRVVDDPTDGALARQFAEWYTTNTDRLRRLAENARYAPVHTELVGDSDLPESASVFSEQSSRGYPMPTNPKMNQVWVPFRDALTAVYNDNMGLPEALATAEGRIREAWAEEER